jgi:hypothetical protein
MTNAPTDPAQGQQDQPRTPAEGRQFAPEMQQEARNDPRSQARAEQLKARFPDISDDEIELARTNVEQAATALAERSGQDFQEVKQAIQSTWNANQSAGTYEQGRGNAPSAAQLTDQGRRNDERRQSESEQPASKSKASKESAAAKKGKAAPQ